MIENHLDMIENHFIFYPVQELETNKFYRLSGPGATFYDFINTIYQFIEPFLDNKMSTFEEYGAFKHSMITVKLQYIVVLGVQSPLLRYKGSAI